MPCQFCGNEFGPDRKKSGEHAWAQWLAGVLPKKGATFTHTIRQGSHGPVTAQWTNEEISIIAGKVCEPCNGGWMNDLENAARRYLSSLVGGATRYLYREPQVTLAAWAAKTALALHLATPAAVPIPSEHYRALANLKTEPSPYMTVYVGAYEGWRTGYYQPVELRIREPGNDPRHGYQATFLIGHAMFQVIGHIGQSPMTFTKEGAWADAAPQIWPVVNEPVDWPPRLVLTEDTLFPFIDAWPTEPE